MKNHLWAFMFTVASLLILYGIIKFMIWLPVKAILILIAVAVAVIFYVMFYQILKIDEKTR